MLNYMKGENRLEKMPETLNNLRDIYGYGYASIFNDVTDTVQKLHISKPQMEVIKYLFIHTQATPKELAEALNTTKSAVTHTLKKLSNKNLITFKENELTNDRRSKLVSLNANAEKLLIEFLTNIKDSIHQDIKDINEEELQELHQATEIILKYIDGGRVNETYPEI
ncbi:MarR family transcriptional regulator [Lacicoccus alkaliphilus]|uniref:DNA-binding transcriptional regulator, MarR family n=2 Tax=Lacicoccus TaxID=3076172 RepID=A0A1M7II62_9BACL|nr:DNA-binding transcriptional regulator, MarR family [Salinicoccus alkaliphilus DSM 16010]